MLFSAFASPQATAQQVIEKLTINGSITVPRMKRPPTLEEFVEMKPPAEFAQGGMVKVRSASPTQSATTSARLAATEIYLGYDQKNLYAVFLCFDREPNRVRGHMAKREDAQGDENAEIMLDTFSDRRRAYGFMSNPLGVQTDGVWTEGQGWDMSWDTIWSLQGQD